MNIKNKINKVRSNEELKFDTSVNSEINKLVIFKIISRISRIPQGNDYMSRNALITEIFMELHQNSVHKQDLTNNLKLQEIMLVVKNLEENVEETKRNELYSLLNETTKINSITFNIGYNFHLPTKSENQSLEINDQEEHSITLKEQKNN